MRLHTDRRSGKGQRQSGSNGVCLLAETLRVCGLALQGTRSLSFTRVSQPKLSGMVWDIESPSSVEAMAVLPTCDVLESDPPMIRLCSCSRIPLVCDGEHVLPICCYK